MHRVFVAFPLPAAHREALARLAGGVPGARWVAPDNLHLTLKFIGEVPGPLLGDIDAALQSVAAAPFPLTLGGMESFGRGKDMRTLHVPAADASLAGPGEATDRLAALAAKIDRALVEEGFEPETRKFAPHVTLARLSRQASKSRAQAFLAEHALLRLPAFTPTHFCFYESYLGKEGSHYEVLADYPLQSAV